MSNGITARKGAFTTGYVTLAVILAEYIPYIKDMPKELTVPLIAGALNVGKNLAKHHFKFDIFKNA